MALQTGLTVSEVIEINTYLRNGQDSGIGLILLGVDGYSLASGVGRQYAYDVLGLNSIKESDAALAKKSVA